MLTKPATKCSFLPSFRDAKTVTAFLVSAVFFYSNVLTAYSAESAFWAERRNAANRMKKSAELADNVANIGLAAERQNRGLSAEQYQLLAQLPKATNLEFGMSESVTNGLPSTGKMIREDLKAAVRNDGKNTPTWISSLILPYGAIRDVYLSKSPDAPIIIHIQDAHGIEDAQRNMASLIQGLREERGITLVGLEGAQGEFALDPYRSFPDAAITKGIAEYFMKSGTIGGPEFVGITAPQPPLLWGVEDMSKYESNIQAFKDSVKYKPGMSAFLKELKDAMFRLKAGSYSPKLKEFDRHYGAYKNRQEGLGSYVRYLMDAQRNSEMRFPNLRILLNALDWEESLDFKRVESERLQLVEAMAKKLSEDSLSYLVQQSLLYRLGRMGYGDYHRFLRKLCHENKIDLELYPQLNSYITYVLLAEQINRNELLVELSNAEESAQDALAVTPEQKKMVAINRNLLLLEKLTQHTMTMPDWLYYDQNKNELLKIADRLKDVAGPLGMTLALTPAEAVPLAPTSAGSEQGATPSDNQSVRTLPFATMLQPYEDFCRYAMGRNNALLENLLEKIEKENASSAVLVAGGFHTEGLTQLLRQKDVSYVVVTPKINEVPKENNYLDVFAHDPLPIEKMFNGEQIYLVSPRVTSDKINLNELMEAKKFNGVFTGLQYGLNLGAENLELDAIKGAADEKILQKAAEHIPGISSLSAGKIESRPGLYFWAPFVLRQLGKSIEFNILMTVEDNAEAGEALAAKDLSPLKTAPVLDGQVDVNGTTIHFEVRPARMNGLSRWVFGKLLGTVVKNKNELPAAGKSKMGVLSFDSIRSGLGTLMQQGALAAVLPIADIGAFVAPASASLAVHSPLLPALAAFAAIIAAVALLARINFRIRLRTEVVLLATLLVVAVLALPMFTRKTQAIDLTPTPIVLKTTAVPADIKSAAEATLAPTVTRNQTAAPTATATNQEAAREIERYKVMLDQALESYPSDETILTRDEMRDVLLNGMTNIMNASPDLGTLVFSQIRGIQFTTKFPNGQPLQSAGMTDGIEFINPYFYGSLSPSSDYNTWNMQNFYQMLNDGNLPTRAQFIQFVTFATSADQFHEAIHAYQGNYGVSSDPTALTALLDSGNADMPINEAIRLFSAELSGPKKTTNITAAERERQAYIGEWLAGRILGSTPNGAFFMAQHSGDPGVDGTAFGGVLGQIHSGQFEADKAGVLTALGWIEDQINQSGHHVIHFTQLNEEVDENRQPKGTFALQLTIDGEPSDGAYPFVRFRYEFVDGNFITIIVDQTNISPSLPNSSNAVAQSSFLPGLFLMITSAFGRLFGRTQRGNALGRRYIYYESTLDEMSAPRDTYASMAGEEAKYSAPVTELPYTTPFLAAFASQVGGVDIPFSTRVLAFALSVVLVAATFIDLHFLGGLPAARPVALGIWAYFAGSFFMKGHAHLGYEPAQMKSLGKVGMTLSFVTALSAVALPGLGGIVLGLILNVLGHFVYNLGVDKGRWDGPMASMMNPKGLPVSPLPGASNGFGLGIGTAISVAAQRLELMHLEDEHMDRIIIAKDDIRQKIFNRITERALIEEQQQEAINTLETVKRIINERAIMQIRPLIYSSNNFLVSLGFSGDEEGLLLPDDVFIMSEFQPFLPQLLFQTAWHITYLGDSTKSNPDYEKASRIALFGTEAVADFDNFINGYVNDGLARVIEGPWSDFIRIVETGTVEEIQKFARWLKEDVIMVTRERGLTRDLLTIVDLIIISLEEVTDNPSSYPQVRNRLSLMWIDFAEEYLVPLGFYGSLDLVHDEDSGRYYFDDTMFRVLDRYDEKLPDNSRLSVVTGTRIDRTNTEKSWGGHSTPAWFNGIFIDIDAINKVVDGLQNNPIFDGLSRDEIFRLVFHNTYTHERTHKTHHRSGINYSLQDNLGIPSGVYSERWKAHVINAVSSELVAHLAELAFSESVPYAIFHISSQISDKFLKTKPQYFWTSRWIITYLARKLNLIPQNQWLNPDDTTTLAHVYKALLQRPDEVRDAAKKLFGWAYPGLPGPFDAPKGKNASKPDSFISTQPGYSSMAGEEAKYTAPVTELPYTTPFLAAFASQVGGVDIPFSTRVLAFALSVVLVAATFIDLHFLGGLPAARPVALGIWAYFAGSFFMKGHAHLGYEPAQMKSLGKVGMTLSFVTALSAVALPGLGGIVLGLIINVLGHFVYNLGVDKGRWGGPIASMIAGGDSPMEVAMQDISTISEMLANGVILDEWTLEKAKTALDTIIKGTRVLPDARIDRRDIIMRLGDIFLLVEGAFASEPDIPLVDLLAGLLNNDEFLTMDQKTAGQITHRLLTVYNDKNLGRARVMEASALMGNAQNPAQVLAEIIGVEEMPPELNVEFSHRHSTLVIQMEHDLINQMGLLPASPVQAGAVTLDPAIQAICREFPEYTLIYFQDEFIASLAGHEFYTSSPYNFVNYSQAYMLELVEILAKRFPDNTPEMNWAYAMDAFSDDNDTWKAVRKFIWEQQLFVKNFIEVLAAQEVTINPDVSFERAIMNASDQIRAMLQFIPITEFESLFSSYVASLEEQYLTEDLQDELSSSVRRTKDKAGIQGFFDSVRNVVVTSSLRNLAHEIQHAVNHLYTLLPIIQNALPSTVAFSRKLQLVETAPAEGRHTPQKPLLVADDNKGTPLGMSPWQATQQATNDLIDKKAPKWVANNRIPRLIAVSLIEELGIQRGVGSLIEGRVPAIIASILFKAALATSNPFLFLAVGVALLITAFGQYQFVKNHDNLAGEAFGRTVATVMFNLVAVLPVMLPQVFGPISMATPFVGIILSMLAHFAWNLLSSLEMTQGKVPRRTSIRNVRAYINRISYSLPSVPGAKERSFAISEEALAQAFKEVDSRIMEAKSGSDIVLRKRLQEIRSSTAMMAKLAMVRQHSKTDEALRKEIVKMSTPEPFLQLLRQNQDARFNRLYEIASDNKEVWSFVALQYLSAKATSRDTAELNKAFLIKISGALSDLPDLPDPEDMENTSLDRINEWVARSGIPAKTEEIAASIRSTYGRPAYPQAMDAPIFSSFWDTPGTDKDLRIQYEDSYSLFAAVEYALARGLSGVEVAMDFLAWDSSKRLGGEYTDRELDRMNEMATLLNVQMPEHTSLIGPALMLEDAADNVELIKEQIRKASRVRGADNTAVVHIATTKGPEMKKAFRRYAELVLEAHNTGTGFRIVFENYFSKGSNTKATEADFPSASEFMDAFEAIAEIVAKKNPAAVANMATLADVAHFNLNGEDPVVSVYTIRKRLKAFSIKYGVPYERLLGEIHNNQNVGKTAHFAGWSDDIHAPVSMLGPIEIFATNALAAREMPDIKHTIEQIDHPSKTDIELMSSSKKAGKLINKHHFEKGAQLFNEVIKKLVNEDPAFWYLLIRTTAEETSIIERAYTELAAYYIALKSNRNDPAAQKLLSFYEDFYGEGVTAEDLLIAHFRLRMDQFVIEGKVVEFSHYESFPGRITIKSVGELDEQKFPEITPGVRTLMSQGNIVTPENDFAFIILPGEVKSGSLGRFSYTDTQIHIGELEHSMIYGEGAALAMALATKESKKPVVTRNATITVRDDAKVVVIPIQTLIDMIKRNPVLKQLLQDVAAKRDYTSRSAEETAKQIQTAETPDLADNEPTASILGSEYRGIAVLWEAVYALPFAFMFVKPLLQRMGRADLADRIGETRYSTPVGLAGSVTFSLGVVAAIVSQTWIVMIASVVLWSLASAYVFSGAHKGKSTTDRIKLGVLGFVMAGALYTPALLFVAGLGLQSLPLLLAVGLLLNIAFHAFNNFVLAPRGIMPVGNVFGALFNHRFTLWAIKGGILNPALVFHDYMIKRIVNSDNRPGLKVLYGGAGADISNVILSTDADDFYFAARYPGISVKTLSELPLAYPNERYKDHKFSKGYGVSGVGGDLDRAHAINGTLYTELKALNVDINSITYFEDDYGIPSLSFMWDYPNLDGSPGQPRLRTIHLVNIDDMTRLDEVTDDNRILLNVLSQEQFDIYYQRAPYYMPLSYLRKGSQEARRLNISDEYLQATPFLEVVDRAMKPGSYYLTDDTAIDPINGRSSTINMRENFPLPYNQIEIDMNEVIEQFHKYHLTPGYGISIQVRQKLTDEEEPHSEPTASILGSEYRGIAVLWEAVYALPFVFLFVKPVLRLINPQLANRVGGTRGTTAVGLAGSVTFSLGVVTAIVSQSWIVMIASVFLWSLASAYVFSGAHKGKSTTDRIKLGVLGFVMAGALYTPALLFVAGLGLQSLPLLLAVGLLLNIAFHAFNNFVLAPLGMGPIGSLLDTFKTNGTPAEDVGKILFKNAQSYLEVGSGADLYLIAVGAQLGLSSVTSTDMDPTHEDFTGKLVWQGSFMKANGLSNDPVTFIQGDFTKQTIDHRLLESYDAVGLPAIIGAPGVTDDAGRQIAEKIILRLKDGGLLFVASKSSREFDYATSVTKETIKRLGYSWEEIERGSGYSADDRFPWMILKVSKSNETGIERSSPLTEERTPVPVTSKITHDTWAFVLKSILDTNNSVSATAQVDEFLQLVRNGAAGKQPSPSDHKKMEDLLVELRDALSEANVANAQDIMGQLTAWIAPRDEELPSNTVDTVFSVRAEDLKGTVKQEIRDAYAAVRHRANKGTVIVIVKGKSSLTADQITKKLQGKSGETFASKQVILPVTDRLISLPDISENPALKGMTLSQEPAVVGNKDDFALDQGRFQPEYYSYSIAAVLDKAIQLMQLVAQYA